MQAVSLVSEPLGKFMNTGVGSLFLPDPRTEPESPTLQADSLPAELPGKHCNNENQLDQQEQSVKDE